MLGESSVSIYWIESKGLADHFPRTVGSHTQRIEGMSSGRQQRTKLAAGVASGTPNIEAELTAWLWPLTVAVWTWQNLAWKPHSQSLIHVGP